MRENFLSIGLILLFLLWLSSDVSLGWLKERVAKLEVKVQLLEKK